MKQTAADVFDQFERVANVTADKCNEAYYKVCEKNNVSPIGKVKVIRYQDLLEYATSKFGSEFVDAVKADIYFQDDWNEREKCLRITDRLMIQCQELAPAMVILFAPPYYPAVNSTENELIKACTNFVAEKAAEKFGLSVERIHYFNGICDLSYVNYTDTNEGWVAFEKNTPVWGDSYSIPFKEMEKLNAPVLNIGPFGKDAHKRTERRSEEHTSELQSRGHLVCRLLLEKKK